MQVVGCAGRSDGAQTLHPLTVGFHGRDFHKGFTLGSERCIRHDVFPASFPSSRFTTHREACYTLATMDLSVVAQTDGAYPTSYAGHAPLNAVHTKRLHVSAFAHWSARDCSVLLHYIETLDIDVAEGRIASHCAHDRPIEISL